MNGKAHRVGVMNGGGSGHAGALLVVLIGLAFGLAGCSPAEERQAGARRECVFERLGTEIARRHPGAKVLLVGNPFAAKPGADASFRDAEEASVRGLKRGLGNAVSMVGLVHPALRPEAEANPQSVPIPAGATTPISFLTVPGAWDQLQKAAPMADTWVSLVGFPADLTETRAWTDLKGPQWVMFLPDWRIVGSREALRSAFANGRLLMAVLSKPGAPPESEPMSRNHDEEFDRRYLLVTLGNLDALIGEWPQLFP